MRQVQQYAEYYNFDNPIKVDSFGEGLVFINS